MKQECKDCNKSLEDCTCLEDTIELPNQALKDAAERYIAEDNNNRYYNDFIEGAKWQQERMYSKEEVLNILNEFCDNFYENSIRKDVIEKWFEQFKKK